MKKRMHFYIVIGVLLIGLIIGSINNIDLKIDQALFDRNNMFGLIMASFGVYPCYMGLAFIGGGLMVTTRKREGFPIWGKIICYGLSILAYGMSVYLCGRELPSVNGFDKPNLAILSYVICAVLFAGVYVLAYIVCNRGDIQKLWPILIVMTIIFVVGLLPAGFIIKLIIHRPRYRYAVFYEETEFFNWWQMFPTYKDHIREITVDGGKVINITKEEFKSFPSGHSGTGAIMMMFLPYAVYFFPKLKGKETLLFYIGFAFALLMMFSRLIVGAHYLTDTCMGSLIVMVAYYVTNEFALRKNLFDDKKEEQLENNNNK